MKNNMIIVFLMLLLLLVVFFLLITTSNKKAKKLNSIKSIEVGDGQHGNAHWMDSKEKQKLYEEVILPTEIVDMEGKFKPGRIIEFDPKTRKMLVDTSDTHANIKAPSGTGKSTAYLIPNVQYNMMAGASMIIPDTKGEIRENTEADAIALGYKTYSFDFVDVTRSNTIDLFEDINENMEKYLRDDDIVAKANSESFAGELATEITSARERGSSENQFFLGASKGLIQSLILLVSMFGEKSQKHLSSVRSLMQYLASTPKEKNDPQSAMIKLMADMPEDFGPKKQLGAAYAAASETEANIYSSSLDDLLAFNNAIGEQVISVPQKPGKFSYKDLVEHKSIVYIVLPDDKSEFKIFGKVILKKIIQQLGNYASSSPSNKLPRNVYVKWEEFAEYSKIENVGSWLQVKRGQGILFDLIYQDEAALKEKYGENIAKVLRNNCGLSIVLGVAQEDEEYAEKLSKILGNKTVQSGSISITQNTGSITSASSSKTTSMMEQPLMSVSEILKMEENDIQIILKRGHSPMKTHFYPYFTKEWGLSPKKMKVSKNSQPFYRIEYMSFQALKDKLEEYKIKLRTDQDRIFSINYDKKEAAANLLLERTKDVKLYDMIMNDCYTDAMQLVTEKYTKVISRLEMQKILTSIIK